MTTKRVLGLFNDLGSPHYSDGNAPYPRCNSCKYMELQLTTHRTALSSSDAAAS
jgi:hypothetical protein